MKKKDDSAAYDLRDRPVPPVKGAVTGEDIRPRPEQQNGINSASVGDSGAPGSWL